MQIAEARRDGVVAVVPAGRIDTTSAPALEGHLNALLAGGARRVVVDFSRVDYISSAGLRVMLLVARRMKDSNGRLALCAFPEPVRQVFQLAGFLPLFTVCESQDIAMGQLAGS
jgi:anti-anti-sigma factor